MRGLSVALFLCLTLAGCLGGGDDPEPTRTTTTSTSATSTTTGPPQPVDIPLLLGFGLQDCQGSRVTQPTDTAAVAALLPEGFTPATSSATGIDPPQANLGAEAVHCTTFTATTSEFQDVWFGRVFIPVEAPTERYPGRDLTADRHEYVFQLLARDDILGQLWPAAGYDTQIGAGAHNVTDLLVAAMASTSLGEYGFSVQGAAQAGSVAGSFAWYTLHESGDTLLWTGDQDLPLTHQGLATVDVPGSSPLTGQGLLMGDDELRGQGGIVAGASWSSMDLVRVTEIQ